MTNIVDGLLGRIEDESLRAALTAEVSRLRETKDFGLVFERHLPENVRLPNHPIRRGTTVQERTEAGNAWMVRRVRNGEAHLVSPDGEEAVRPIESLVAVRAFGEPVYPGVVPLGSIDRGGDKPSHVVIKGENHHVLETLLYTHEGAVDCCYIDPPYNTGARDWKYNNDYVDENDNYRHSKWLSFMEKRLQLAKRLLNPERSVLIVTIDEKEYLRLGLLLEEVFKGCRIQMVSITISPRGTSRTTEFSRVDEYAFFVFIGEASVTASTAAGTATDTEVRWQYLRRTQKTLVRGSRPNQFYPIYVDTKSKQIVEVGEPMTTDEPLDGVPEIPGAVPVFPIDPNGLELIWGLTPPTLRHAAANGYVRVSDGNEHQPYTIAHLSTTNIKRVERGELQVTGTREDGSKIVVVPGGKAERLSTVWRETRHDAGAYGTSLLRALLPGRSFPFPKSLYAVEDTLRSVLADSPDALILDFFGGSGTTAHAVARLNHQDGGRRRSIVVTNNEVSEDEAKALRNAGHQAGDPEWEALGIFEHVTRPRITAAITGQTPDGQPVAGDYRFTDEFPMAEGFAENVQFLELTYLDRNDVARGKAFESIAPLLWLKAGGAGEMITKLSKKYAAPAEARYAVLFDVSHWQEFAEEVRDREDLVHIFVVTDSSAQYQQVSAELPNTVEVTMLYEDYLRNFEINVGGGAS